MGQEVCEVKQGARGIKPIERAAFQSSLAIGGGCFPFCISGQGMLLKIPLSYLFFRAMAAGLLAWDKLKSCHRLLEWTL